MSLQEYITVIGNGFLPIILVAYFLWKESKNKDDLKALIAEYRDTINTISTKHEETLTRISETLVLMNERIKNIETENKKDERLQNAD